MKKILIAIIASGTAMFSMAQDTTKIEKTDTIRIGGTEVIIRNSNKEGQSKTKRDLVINKKKRNSNLSTNWWILDLGFANINDKSNYAASQAQGFTGNGIGHDQFDLRTAKSINANVWFFMQKLNVAKHVVNLKYGLGLELNNYYFDDNRVRFNKNPTKIVLDSTLTSGVQKNKLAADYITVPFMLNFNFSPNHKRGFGLSAGVSAGYLYDARQKIKTGNNKNKLHDDFDLRKWKISYIGELSLGPVRLYGSYALKSMWEKGLDQTPYNVGIRFSRW